MKTKEVYAVITLVVLVLLAVVGSVCYHMGKLNNLGKMAVIDDAETCGLYRPTDISEVHGKSVTSMEKIQVNTDGVEILAERIFVLNSRDRATAKVGKIFAVVVVAGKKQLTEFPPVPATNSAVRLAKTGPEKI
jgi:hypothetical protein